MNKPERPLDNECCGGGACQPCVWDHYFDQLEKWQTQQDELKALEEPNTKPSSHNND